MGHHLLLAKDAVGSSATYKLVFHSFIINFPKARPTSWYICCFTLQGGGVWPSNAFFLMAGVSAEAGLQPENNVANW